MKKLRTLRHRFLSRPFKLHIKDDVGHGPVLIFLHGIASSSASWEPLIPMLKDHYRCITIDLLGFGQSPKPDWSSYSITQHVRSIHRTIRGLKLGEPYILVGHSLGSLLACRYARRYNKEIARLIMLSPPIYFHSTQYGHRRTKQASNLYLTLYRMVRTRKSFTLTNMSRVAKLFPPLARLDLSDENWIPFARSLENSIESQTVITDIAEVTAPIDVFYGSRDQVIVPRNLKVLATMRHVTIHPVKGASHFLGNNYREEIAKLLTHYV